MTGYFWRYQDEFQEAYYGVLLQGKMLRGAGNQIKSANAGKIAKLSGNQPQLAMIQVISCVEDRSMQWYSLETSIENCSSNPDLTTLLEKYKDLLVEPTALPPSRGIFDHQIILKNGTEPINERLYRYPAVKKDIIEGLVKQMLDQGIIQPSSSPFASPVVLVGKKDGTWRLCVDYRDLIKQDIKSKFPIPIMKDLLDELGGSVLFSKIDLRSGYHQLRMAVDDIPITNFRTHSGHYAYLVMPFGLSNAPTTFQGLMNSIFHQFLRKFVLVFFDDILIYNKHIQDHLQHLQLVFEEMRRHQLFAKRSKCSFGVQMIEYLRHFITAEGVSTDPQKIMAIQNSPIPTTLKQLRGFLGLAGYYRRFIKSFGIISRPLTDLLKKEGFKWSPEATEAFNELKKALTQARVSTLLDFTKTFVVETGASGYGVGAVLMQQGHPIAFIRKALSHKKTLISVYDGELLAICHAIMKWSQYLLGQRFIIRTNQRALKFLMEQKIHTSTQLRCLTKLMPFDYIIEYKK